LVSRPEPILELHDAASQISNSLAAATGRSITRAADGLERHV
jgi:hypothetical protein